MRRNTVTLLKYLVAAVIFLVTGPIALKFIFGGRQMRDIYVDDPRGMPVAPRESRHVVEVNVLDFSNTVHSNKDLI